MSDKEIVTVESKESLAQQADPMLGMIDKVCSDPNFDIAKMEKLIEMRNAEIERRASIEFSICLAEMQAELPIVEKKGAVYLGKEPTPNSRPSWTYAKYEDVIEEIRPILKKYGFSLSHQNLLVEGNPPTIRTTLKHKGGHKESTERSAPADTSGSKNNLQALGSTRSYLRKYNTFDLLDIVVKDEDDDGQVSESKVINKAQLDEITTLLEQSGVDKVKFIRDYLKIDSLKNLPAKNYNKAVNVLRKRIQDANS